MNMNILYILSIVTYAKKSNRTKKYFDSIYLNIYIGLKGV